MLAKRPEDRFGSMCDVANALDAYLAGRPTGVVTVPLEQTAETKPLKTGPSAGRGIMIAPWMLVTALVLIIGGFGITWRLIAVMLKQQVASGEIALSQSTREALSHGNAHVLINGKELTREQLQKPIVLPAGSNNFQVQSKNETTPAQTIPSGTEDPTLLERGSDGNWVYKPLQQHVAESVLARGGKLKLVGSDTVIAHAPDLPTSGSLHIEEINLAGTKAFPGEEIELIKKLTKTLKRLLLPKSGVSDRQFSELRDALKDCKVERGVGKFLMRSGSPTILTNGQFLARTRAPISKARPWRFSSVSAAAPKKGERSILRRAKLPSWAVARIATSRWPIRGPRACIAASRWGAMRSFSSTRGARGDEAQRQPRQAAAAQAGRRVRAGRDPNPPRFRQRSQKHACPRERKNRQKAESGRGRRSTSWSARRSFATRSAP